MTWIVVLMMGNGVVAAYITSFRFLLLITLDYIVKYGPYSGIPTFPFCPQNCLNVWPIDFLLSEEQPSCFCDARALTQVSKRSGQARRHTLR